MDLFSDMYPRLDACRSNAPVYIYGPRGCGKSTILRSLSLKAILESENPSQELSKIPFLGVYISSSQELRSRFWLMREEEFDALEGHVVRYFNLLLIEGLVETLDRILQWDARALTYLISVLAKAPQRSLLQSDSYSRRARCGRGPVRRPVAF